MTSVRTRFAPSPTGYLHVGGLRTALFNYLLAKHHGGQYLLRIEDTDQNRKVEGAVENLISSLKWAGLQHDEGPDVGGDFGPYVQSQRTEIYRDHAMQLLKNGHAYYCFCTPDELEAMRERQMANGETARYDGTWRDRDVAEIRAKLDDGTPHVIRLKMPNDGETVFTDLIRGEVRVQNELVDDQVLLKSDGFPTYHLANVVDDHLMGITHVIRGEEWLLSVPKHLQLYKAFGWDAPKMAHLPLLLNQDRTKLSKRQGDVAVEDYIAKGYLPEALINFVALLGWNPGTDEEFFSMTQLAELFSLDRVNKSGAVFDTDKLNWMNGNYIRQMDEASLVAFLTPFLANAGADVSDAATTAKIITAVQKKIDRGDQIFEAARIFYKDTLEISDPEALEILQQETAKPALAAVAAQIESLDVLDNDSFKAVMKSVQKESGIKGPGLWKPVRVALTGEASGPELAIVIEVFGKEKSLSYIRQTLDKISQL
ncbi:MAG: glutamate--tRNA ligase [Calditrichaeota bacterium]|nr:glutamate--tRNA ligase [Calditrichota bacterium]MCB0269226.1 glutamate--tRNA ligase [Calditrichota bacterium]MCB9068973.1 glutamate--tRNA ligase [Calditrichia bacterium]